MLSALVVNFTVMVVVAIGVTVAASNCSPSGGLLRPEVQDFSLLPRSSDLGPCILMSFGVYIRLERNKYINLDKGKLNRILSRCPGDVLGLISVDYECLKLNIYINRKNDSAPVEVVDISGEIKSTGVQFLEKTEGKFSAKEPNHAYRCNREQSLPLEETRGMEIVFTGMHIEAYREPNKRNYYQIEDHCDDEILVPYNSIMLVVVAAGAMAGLILCFSCAQTIRRRKYGYSENI